MNAATNNAFHSPRRAAISLGADAPQDKLDRFMRIKEVSAITGLAKATVYRYVSDGIFPRPIPLGGRRVAWLLSELEAWMNERLAKRTTTKEPA